MRGLYEAGSRWERGRVQPSDAERVKSGHGADDVYEGIDIAEFVEVKVLAWLAVRQRLGLADASKNFDGLLLDARWHWGCVDDPDEFF